MLDPTYKGERNTLAFVKLTGFLRENTKMYIFVNWGDFEPSPTRHVVVPGNILGCHDLSGSTLGI